MIFNLRQWLLMPFNLFTMELSDNLIIYFDNVRESCGVLLLAEGWNVVSIQVDVAGWNADLLSRPLKRTQDQDLVHQVSRPRPWTPGLETKTLTTRSRDQDLDHQVSRPRP